MDIFRHCQHFCNDQNRHSHFFQLGLAYYGLMDQSLLLLATAKASVSVLETVMRTQYVLKLHYFLL